MKKALWIDSGAGISLDRFAAALIGLGVPESGMIQAIKDAVEDYSLLDAHVHLEFLPGDVVAHRLHLMPLNKSQPISWGEVLAVLEKGLDRAGIENPYGDYARQAVSIIQEALRQSSLKSSRTTVPLPVIGTAHTPYDQEAPYQPRAENTQDGDFFIQVEGNLVEGLQSLDSFSHIYVLSYLDRSIVHEVTVTPPWKDQSEQYGVFATRSPNRPSPIGLTRVRLRRIVGNRIYTGPLDLFDGTPILDIKPYIETLDGAASDEPGNDGWLEGSDHLELHRLGLPHAHPSVSGNHAQPLLLIALLTGIIWGLQYLEVSSIICKSPVGTGSEHMLDPAVEHILETFQIPHQPVAESAGVLGPEGAALLASLAPHFVATGAPSDSERNSSGLGSMIPSELPESGRLRMYLFDDPDRD